MGFIKKIGRKLAPYLFVLIILALLLSVFFIDNIKSILILLIVAFITYSIISRTAWFKQYVLNRLRGAFWHIYLKSGRHLNVAANVKFLNPSKITLGEHVDVAENVAFCPLNNIGETKYPSEIIVGNRVHFGPFDRIASMEKVTIEDDVLFAAFVHVTDHSHEYRKAGVPVWQQGVYSEGPVVIKRGAWLGFGCHVLSGVTIGEFSIVGANSTVTKSIPPYSVAVGSPARVVKRFNFDTNTWESVK
ncbi:acyltransferase [Butyrivibrio sp. WCD2001]|uniref:acyltransferase n=1 Tax=Butyrivibrio sp. WCD2001 TaxID=1280681 RepID=UPI000407CA94|nr:acyltransferase [Butyrivibrio sp. WCD2001]